MNVLSIFFNLSKDNMHLTRIRFNKFKWIKQESQKRRRLYDKCLLSTCESFKSASYNMAQFQHIVTLRNSNISHFMRDSNYNKTIIWFYNHIFCCFAIVCTRIIVLHWKRWESAGTHPLISMLCWLARKRKTHSHSAEWETITNEFHTIKNIEKICY